MDKVSVITLTRGRPNKLERAIRSVANQTYSGTIDHIIIIDDCQQTLDLLEKRKNSNNMRWHFFPREKADDYITARVAWLRNEAISLSDSKYIAFLDDDNEFATNHIESLVFCLEQNEAHAAHSLMEIYHEDGTPYLEERIPWFRSKSDGRKAYKEFLQAGIVARGSNIYRDRMDAVSVDNPYRTVDMGEWLFLRTLLLKCPFRIDYSEEDWIAMRTEDDKLLDDLLVNGVTVASTGLATLKYFLGGYSNHFAEGCD